MPVFRSSVFGGLRAVDHHVPSVRFGCCSPGSRHSDRADRNRHEILLATYSTGRQLPAFHQTADRGRPQRRSVVMGLGTAHPVRALEQDPSLSPDPRRKPRPAPRASTGNAKDRVRDRHSAPARCPAPACRFRRIPRMRRRALALIAAARPADTGCDKHFRGRPLGSGADEKPWITVFVPPCAVVGVGVDQASSSACGTRAGEIRAASAECAARCS